MNSQRITISMPDYLYTQLMSVVPAGQISKFTADAIENKIVKHKLTKMVDPIEQFLALGGTLKATPKQIRKAINKGRL